MGEKKFIMDEKVASAAAAYYEVGADLDKEVDEYVKSLQSGEKPQKVNILKQIVAMTNMAFSCELFLKSFLDDATRATKKAQVHNLVALFDLFDNDEEIKNFIITPVVNGMKSIHSEYNVESFNKDLSENADVFFDWRYYYEGNKPSINMEFIRVFSGSLQSMYDVQKAILAMNKES